jgi:hypothetical protein
MCVRTVTKPLPGSGGLLRQWCTLTYRVRIEAITIAGDALDFRMLLEPICHPVCRAILQQIYPAKIRRFHRSFRQRQRPTRTRIVTDVP